MNTNTNHMKKMLLPVLALALLLAVPGEARAEGELAWQFNGAPASIHYTDVAVSSVGVFSPRLISWGAVAVQKRNLDNSGGWEVSFPIPVGSWFNGHPRIAADSTGVYVALSSAVTIDVRNGTLSMAKLSPVSGAIISIKNSNAPGYVNVTNIEVDSTGIYVSGGSSADRGYGSTSWRLEKWDKGLSGASPIWGYSSNHSGGNAGDYWGPLGFAMNDQYVYLGGNRLQGGSGQLGVRIEKINKNTGTAEWVRLEGYGTGAVGVLALSDTNLYSVLSNSYWGGAALGVDTSIFEIRPLDNSPTVSAVLAPGRIQALAVDGVSGLYRTYVVSGDSTSRTIIDKVSLIDGSQIGALNVNTGVYSVTKYPSGFGSATPIVNNLSIDNDGIYIAGKDEAALVWGVSGSPRIEKYNHFGSSPGSCGTVTDIDGNTYDTVVIGSQCWMKQNMRVGTRVNAATIQTNNGIIEKYCYNNQDANCTTNHPNQPDGGMYSWNEAMQYSTTEGAQGICPAGWHIPRDAEWHALEDYLKDVGQTCDPNRDVPNFHDCLNAGAKLKPGGSSGFEGNFAGIAGGGAFGFREGEGFFTSSSEKDATYYWLHGIVTSSSGIYRDDTGHKPSAISVRCVQGAGVVAPPDILSLCTTAGIPITSGTAALSRALLAGSSESFNAFYDTTPGICGDSAPIADASWSDSAASGVVSLVGINVSPQTVTANAAGTETVTVSKGTDTITLNYTVSPNCVSSCTPARRAQECSGVTFPLTDSCGVAETCAGTRYCDFNWKEVAPGN